MTHGRRSTMKSSVATRFCHVWTKVLVALLLFHLLGVSYAKPFGSGQQTIRLCSKSLSDALYLICQGRGYNSPFSYSGEDEQRTSNTNGPGLVDECCLQSCSIKQLELYCKPANDESNTQDAMWVRIFLFFYYFHIFLFTLFSIKWLDFAHFFKNKFEHTFSSINCINQTPLYIYFLHSPSFSNVLFTLLF